MVPEARQQSNYRLCNKIHTNVNVGLVSCKGGIVADAVHPPAGALRTKGILNRRDAALVLEGSTRSAQKNL